MMVLKIFKKFYINLYIISNMRLQKFKYYKYKCIRIENFCSIYMNLLLIIFGEQNWGWNQRGERDLILLNMVYSWFMRS